jgi:hypothetical protein
MLGALLAVLAIANLATALAVIAVPQELFYAEAVVYNLAARLLHGEPLYQPLGQAPYTVAAYTPLYYWAGAGLRAVFGPGFAPGRALSLASGLFVAVAVGYTVARRKGAGPAPGLLAALLWLALGQPAWSFLFAYRVDYLGVALSLASVATLASGATRGRAFASGLLAGLAILTKQTLVAAALAGAWWLWRRDRPASVLFAGAAAAVVLPVCGVLEAGSGAFVANTIQANANPTDVHALFAYHLSTLLRYQTGPLVLAGLYVWGRARSGRSPLDDLLAVYWLVSFLPLAGLVKAGAFHNYWIELAAATAMLTALGLWAGMGPLRSGRPPAGRWAAAAPALLLAVAAAAVLRPTLSAARSATRIAEEARARDGEFGRLIERVAAQPGEVLAFPLDVIPLADRPVLLEPVIYSILAEEGQWDARPLVARICAGEVGLLVLDQPLEAEPPLYTRFGTWPRPVLQALRETMVPEGRQAGRFLYVPDPRGPAASCAGRQQ